jgi:hypothetical protein
VTGLDHPRRIFDLTEGLIQRGYGDADFEQSSVAMLCGFSARSGRTSSVKSRFLPRGGRQWRWPAVVANLVIVCDKCNARKSASAAADFIRRFRLPAVKSKYGE